MRMEIVFAISGIRTHATCVRVQTAYVDSYWIHNPNEFSLCTHWGRSPAALISTLNNVYSTFNGE